MKFFEITYDENTMHKVYNILGIKISQKDKMGILRAEKEYLRNAINKIGADKMPPATGELRQWQLELLELLKTFDKLVSLWYNLYEFTKGDIYMNNEARVELVKKACQEMYDSVQPRYNELLKLGDAAKSERNDIVRDVNKALKIYEGVSESNVMHHEGETEKLQKVIYYEGETEKLQKEFTEKYGVKLETKMYSTEISSLDEDTPVDSKKSNGGALLGVGLGAAALGILAGMGLSSCNKDTKTNENNAEVNRVIASNNEAVVEETENGRLVITSNKNQNNGEKATVISDVEQSVNEVVAENLVLGEYGTFFDAPPLHGCKGNRRLGCFYAKDKGRRERKFLRHSRRAAGWHSAKRHRPSQPNIKALAGFGFGKASFVGKRSSAARDGTSAWAKRGQRARPF